MAPTSSSGRRRLSAAAALAACLLAAPASAKLRVFACEPEWKALAEEIGGERVAARAATTAFQDPHRIEARPSLIAAARRADVLFCTGAELEVGWLPLLLRQSGNAAIQNGRPGHFLAAEQVKLIEKPTALDRRLGDVHAAGNPHVHWDPNRLLLVAEAFAERLAAIDPAHAAGHRRRFNDFQRRWRAAIARWEAQAAPLRGARAIVHHRDWSYLLNWLGVETVGDLEPRPGVAPNSAHLAGLLRLTKASQPDFIVIAERRNDKGARWLSARTDTAVLRLPYTVGAGPRAATLEALYTEALARLTAAR